MTDAKTCDCRRCRIQRGEPAHDPPPHPPTDREGCSERLLDGIHDGIELAVLVTVEWPGDGPATRARILSVVADDRKVPLADAERALDKLIGCGLIADEDGELRLTSLSDAAAHARQREP